MEFKITDKVEEREQTEILNGLIEFNLSQIEDKNPRDLGVYYEDEEGHMLAGLIGDTHGNWLTIRFLWVSENLRGQHIGSSILEQAEKTAKERGCRFAFLDTFGFQAPEFYKKHNYHEVFTLDNYPLTGKRHYFTKEL